MLRQIPKLALAAFGLIALSGCQGVYTKIPLEGTRDPRVPGVWQTQGETDTFEVRMDGEEYVAQPQGGDEKPLRFRIVRLDGTGALYVQSGSKPCEAFPGEAECYALARLVFTGTDAAQLFDFDTAAMFSASLQENFGVGYEVRRKVGTSLPPGRPSTISTEFLLSGDPAQLRAFLAKFGARFTSTKSVKYRRVMPKAP